jgi:hypothetical protein
MALCFLIFILCILFPEITGSGIKTGLNMIAGQVIPALYPFILLTTLFRHLSARHKKSRFLSMAIGFLSGYPLGAKTAAEYPYNGKGLSPQSLLLICNNPSPAYMISFVGLHCLNSPAAGLRIYIAVLCGNLFTGLLCSLLHKRRPASPDMVKMAACPTSGNLLDDVIHDTFSVVLTVSSYILVFSVVAAFIKRCTFLSVLWQSLCVGLFEMTTGVQMAAGLSVPVTLKYMLMTGMISFGGLSVLAQTNSMISKSDLSIKKYMKEKAVACAIAVSFMYIISILTSV